MHGALSNLMWTFVVAHAGVALLHQIEGHSVLQRMFGRRTGARDPDRIEPANACSPRRPR